MDMQLAAPEAIDFGHGAPAAAADRAVLDAAERAGRRIAPLWPLRHFVAVNPFLGLSDHTYAAAVQRLRHVAGVDATIGHAACREALLRGRITDADLAAALAEHSGGHAGYLTLAEVKAALHGDSAPALRRLPTVADVAASVSRRDWPGLVTDRVGAWAAGYFDIGQAAWPSPWRGESAYAAWRAEALLDRTPEVMGLPRFREIIAGLPASADAVLVHGAIRLGLLPGGLELYFHRLLLSVSGWASWARYHVWQDEMDGRQSRLLVELLAIRLAWDVALHEALASRTAMAGAWSAVAPRISEHATADTDAMVDAVLQSAYERAWQRDFLGKLTGTPAVPMDRRPAVQAAFCIDVRSELFRRALESLSPDIDTIGFAGFFGFPIEYVPIGRTVGGAQCPVLLKPRFVVCEAVRGEADQEDQRLQGLRLDRLRVGQAWKSFKMAAVSCFGFVETAGWTYLGKLLTDTLGLTRPVPHPEEDGLRPHEIDSLAPRIDPRDLQGRATGFSAETRIDMAEAVLRAMSFTRNFAPLVLLAGHGSTTVNNPHATGLDCGACGGHTGEANARVAALILNDAGVRAGLAARGIAIPADTVFLAGLHDTTTDQVRLFETDCASAPDASHLARLKAWLAQAGALARLERAGPLGLDTRTPQVHARVAARARDWSQVRPEWGLAGCAAFIAAPRGRTRGLDLGGRCFLHDYDWRQDEGFRTLELILTAPVVVASWINLQYFGSAVANDLFGSGNKVLHNVVGTLGVFEGNGGDLRVGLPWQSVHDGTRLMHEPIRLSVLAAAPTEAINAIIARHETVRQLVDNRWVHLFAFDTASCGILRYSGQLRWELAT